jgi:hypothetical protein
VDPERWLAEFQGLHFDSALLRQAAASATRIGTLARESALSLSFDTDPAAFHRIFEALAHGGWTS